MLQFTETPNDDICDTMQNMSYSHYFTAQSCKHDDRKNTMNMYNKMSQFHLSQSPKLK
jgi:hypothetical protein